MTQSDDETLVGNEVDRCLEEAGNRLHHDDVPHPGAQYGRSLGVTFPQAQYYLARVQLLDRLGTARAAQYLRKELLDAIAGDRRDGDSATLQAMGFQPRPTVYTLKNTNLTGRSLAWGTPPPGPGAYSIMGVDAGPAISDPAITYSNIVSMYESLMDQS